MLDHFSSILRQPGPVRRCLWPASAVFVIVLGLGAAHTLRSPETYASTAKISLGTGLIREPGTDSPTSPGGISDLAVLGTECEVLKSEAILGRVLKRLDSIERRGARRESPSQKPGGPERVAQLRSNLEIRLVPGTGEIEICATSEDAGEAAQTANAVAEAYRDFQTDRLRAQTNSWSAVEVSITHRAIPATRPTYRSKVTELSRDALGACCLGLATGAAVAWRLVVMAMPSVAVDVFAPVFIVVLSLVMGVGSLIYRLPITVGVVWGLWLAFAAAAVAHWARFLRKRFPVATKVFPLTFGISFFLLFSPEAFTTFFGRKLYFSTARIRFGMSATNGQAAKPLGGLDPDLIRNFMQTECETATSPDLLSNVVRVLDLNMTFGKEFDVNGAFKTSESIRLLKARIDVSPVRGTTLLEVRVPADKPENSVAIANAVADGYLTRRNRGDPGSIGPDQVRAAVMDAAVPATRPVPMRSFSDLARAAVAAFQMAVLICAGSVFGAWLTEPAGRRFRVFVPLFVMSALLVGLILSVVLALWPETYSSTARVRLVSSFIPGTSRYSTDDRGVVYEPRTLYHECKILESKEFLGAMIGRLATNEATTFKPPLEANPVPETSLIQIRARGADAAGAARFANAASEAYRDLTRGALRVSLPTSAGIRGEIVATAWPAGRPDSARSPLRRGFEVLGGGLLFFSAGAVVSWGIFSLVKLLAERRSSPPSPSEPSA